MCFWRENKDSNSGTVAKKYRKKERERSEINYQVIRERGRKKKKGSIKKQEVRNGRKTGRKDQEGIKGGMKKEKGRNNQGRFNQEEWKKAKKNEGGRKW